LSWLLLPLMLLPAIVVSSLGSAGNSGRPARPAWPGLGGLALRTAAEELDALMGDGEPCAGGDSSARSLGVRLGQRAVDVQDASAAHAGEVVVRGHIGVEASVGSLDLRHQSLGDEEAEVAVDRAQAHPG